MFNYENMGRCCGYETNDNLYADNASAPAVDPAEEATTAEIIEACAWEDWAFYYWKSTGDGEDEYRKAVAARQSLYPGQRVMYLPDGAPVIPQE